MAKVKGTVKIAIETCKGCELCVHECPQETLAMSEELNQRGYHFAIISEDNCTGCTNCALICPDGAITVYRESHGKKTPVARISNITENISLSIDGR
ncbi:MAG: 4Fe-4S dicluster domain-containing protein [Candidatus Neomarinimicrobiota bacterium]